MRRKHLDGSGSIRDTVHSGGRREKSSKKKKSDKRSDKKEKKEKKKSRDSARKSSKPVTDKSNTIEPMDNPEDAGQTTANYANKEEFKAATREVEQRRLREVRLWLLANTIIFVVTAPSLHFTRWENLDYKGQTALIIQAVL